MVGPSQLVGALGLLLGWLVSVHFLPWVSWHAELPVFGALFLVGSLMVVRGVVQGGRTARIAVPRAALFFAALALLALLQTVVGQIDFAGDGLVIGLYCALGISAMSLGYAAVPSGQQGARDRFDDWSSAEILAATLLAGVVLSIVIALAQVFEIWESVGWIARTAYARRPGGNLAQPNQLATLVLMGLASLVFLRERSRLTPGFALALLPLLIVGLAATESRSGALGFLALAGWYLACRRKLQLQLPVWSVVLAAAAFVALFVSWPPLMEAWGSFGAGARINTTSAARLEVWAQLWQAVLMRPWLGWGLHDVAKAHNAVVDAYATSQPFTFAHNVVLDLVLGAGLPLALGAVLLAARWAWQRTLSVASPLQWYGLAVMLPLTVHSMFEFPFAYAYLLVPPLFLLGMLEAEQGRATLSMPAWPLAACALLTALVGLWSVREYVAAEEDFRIVRFEALRVGRTPPQYERPNIVLLTQLDGLLTAGRILPEPGMTPEAMDALRKAALRYPWPATQNRYAVALALNGDRPEALRQLRVMRAIHGERAYAAIRASWMAMAEEKYPQLNGFVPP